MPARTVYILKKGVVKINRVTSEGKEIILDILKKGSIFGDMWLAEPEEMNESAEAIEDGVICGIKAEEFARLLQSMPTLSMRVTRMMLIASTRETVTATVNSLRSKGLIDIEDKYLVIRSLDGLRAISG